MNTRFLQYGLAALIVLLLLVLLFATQDKKVFLDKKYSVGVEVCEKNICTVPLSISDDRLNANILVYNSDTNHTCVERLKDGGISPLRFYDCPLGNHLDKPMSWFELGGGFNE